MKKQYYLKKAYVIVLIVAILLSFTSCQKKNDTKVSNEKYTVTDFTTSIQAEGVQASEVSKYYYRNDKIYFLQNVYDRSTGNHGEAIKSMNTDGTNVETLLDMTQLSVEDGSSQNGNIQNYGIDNSNNIWILLAEYYEIDELDVDLSNTSTVRSVYYIDEYSADKKRINHIDLSTVITATDAFISSFKVTPSGNICLNDNNNMYVLDSTGKLLYTEEVVFINDIALIGDSDIVYMTYDYSKNSNVIRQYDTAKNKVKKESKLGGNYNIIVTEDDNIYIGDNIGFYTYNIDKNKSSLIFKWIDMNINSNDIGDVAALPDKKFLYSEYSDNIGNDIKLIAKDSNLEADERQVITLGCQYMDYNLQKNVVDFNKANIKYRVDVKEYNSANDNDAYSKLNTEIISGNTLDIIDVSDMPDVSNYIRKNLLTDLNTYFEDDDSISRDDFVQSVLSAYETDGNLYSIVQSFEINTLAANKENVGTSDNMTFAEMDECAKQNNVSEMIPNSLQETVLQYALCTSQDSFFDFANKTCSFDSGEFMSVLEYASKFPSEYTSGDSVSHYQKFIDKDTLFINAYLSKGMDYSIYKYLADGNQVFLGYPSTNGNGHIINGSTELAILDKSANKDGAWEFIKYILSKDVQDLITRNFPIRNSSLDKILLQSSESYADENGMGYTSGSVISSGFMIDLTAISDEDINDIKNIIDSLKHTSHYDSNVLDIIKDEATAYFSESKSVEDVATAIQNRVQVYINEQK